MAEYAEAASRAKIKTVLFVLVPATAAALGAATAKACTVVLAATVFPSTAEGQSLRFVALDEGQTYLLQPLLQLTEGLGDLLLHQTGPVRMCHQCSFAGDVHILLKRKLPQAGP